METLHVAKLNFTLSTFFIYIIGNRLLYNVFLIKKITFKYTRNIPLLSVLQLFLLKSSSKFYQAIAKI